MPAGGSAMARPLATAASAAATPLAPRALPYVVVPWRPPTGNEAEALPGRRRAGTRFAKGASGLARARSR